MSRIPLCLCIALVAVVTASSASGAQGILGNRLGVGAYGGVSLPMGDFKTDATLGWHGGATVDVDVRGALDLRVDGVFSRFGDKDFTDGTNIVTQSSEVFFGTLALELNLGTDSAAYPGDNTVSPWILGGLGIYAFDVEAECTQGGCAGVDLSSVAERKWGVNVGAGATVPFAGLRPFVEARYHVVFWDIREQGNVAMLLLSAGLKFK